MGLATSSDHFVRKLTPYSLDIVTNRRIVFEDYLMAEKKKTCVIAFDVHVFEVVHAFSSLSQ